MAKADPQPVEITPPKPDEPATPDAEGPLRFDLPQFLAIERRLPPVRPVIPPLPPPVRLRGVRGALAHWRVKGAVQKLLGVMPGGELVHAELQRRVGGLRDFARECDAKVTDWRLMMGHLRRAGIDITSATMLEIGTGWYPTLPLCFYLAGAQRVMTFDVARRLDRAMTLRLVEHLGAHVAMIAREAGCTEGEVAARYAILHAGLRARVPLARVTSLGVDYRAPADAAHTGLPSSSIEVVFSNSVLEHVPPLTIEALFAEALRVLVPRGVMLHSVNCGDHYAYTDPSIDQLHYLQYSDEEWAPWDNAFLYQNRLRAIDFTTACTRAGFTLEIDTSRAHPERLARLDAMKVHPRFARYSREQLAITSVDFVGRKPARGTDN